MLIIGCDRYDLDQDISGQNSSFTIGEHVLMTGLPSAEYTIDTVRGTTWSYSSDKAPAWPALGVVVANDVGGLFVKELYQPKVYKIDASQVDQYNKQYRDEVTSTADCHIWRDVTRFVPDAKTPRATSRQCRARNTQ